MLNPGLTKSFGFVSVLLLIVAAAPPLADATTGMPAAPASALALLDAGSLAQGPYASMHARLRRTIFRLNVLEIDLQFDAATRDRLAAIASSSDSLAQAADALALAASRAENAFACISFQRNVPLKAFNSAVAKELERALNGGMITDVDYNYMTDNLPVWFGSLAKRGFRDGDKLIQRLRPDSVRTLLIDEEGRIILDNTLEGAQTRTSLLSGYLAPQGALREGLLRSLF